MDEIEIIRGAFATAERDPEARERARVRLRNAITAEPTAEVAIPVAIPSRPLLRPARWLGAAAAIVAAVLVAQTVFTQHQSGPTPDALARAHSHAVVAAALENLAAAASASQPGPIPKGKFALLSSQTTTINDKITGDEGTENTVTGQSYDLSVGQTVLTWIGPDGRGRSNTTTDSVSFVTEEDQRTWVAMGRPELRYTVGDVEKRPVDPWGALGLDPSTLPTDPSALEEALRKSTTPGGGLLDDALVMEHIASLLSDGAPSPALRAALFKVLEGLPEIRLLGQVQDPQKRTGVGFVLPLVTQEMEIIVDPSTSDVWATLTYSPNLGGALRFSTVYGDATIVSGPHVAS